MKTVRKLLLIAAMFGIATSALGGTYNAFTFYPVDAAPVKALANPVTYSTPASGKIPAMQTYVGFVVGDPVKGLLSNSSGNTVNDVTITFTASVTDKAELLTFYLPEVYVLPSGCTRDTVPSYTRTVTCKVRQLKNGGGFPAFTVFFVAPQKVCQATTAPDNACGGTDDVPGGDTISTTVTAVYAEGLSGPSPVHPNSNQERSQPNLVVLGTTNPIYVKSAVPKTGARVFTGVGAAPVPVPPAVPNSQFAELLNVPPLTDAYAVVEISVETSSDADVISCMNGGRFKVCPTFRTTVASDTGVEKRFDPENPLRFTYRIDASNLKLSASKILNSTTILYSGKRYDGIEDVWTNKSVDVCVNGAARTDGLPCIESSRCYKRNETGGIADLENDCEWTLINTGNGLLKLQ